jgi:hypothetical protein
VTAPAKPRADLSAVEDILTELANNGVKYVLTFQPSSGYHWYLVNPWGPEEQEDWIFHALKTGVQITFEDAVEALGAAASALNGSQP